MIRRIPIYLSLSKESLICLSLLFIFTSCEVIVADTGEELPPPNIVWFMSEDNSPFLGSYGNEFVHTPTLDSLAALGIRYENAYSNAPVCAPSRSGIITGMLPVSIGSQHMRSSVELPEEYRYYIDFLKDQGYYLSLRLKRDYNIARDTDAWEEDDWWDFEEALANRGENQPFYMFYNTWQSHEGKIHGEQEGYEYFQATFESRGQSFIDSVWSSFRAPDPETIKLPDYLPDLPEVRNDLALYYTLMEALDFEFREFLKALEMSGELQNTIIIYSSDHGGVMARSKRFAMETGLHVPMFIWFPPKYEHLAPSRQGSSNDDIVTLLDIPPTILQLAGAATPDYFQGVSLLESGEGRHETAFGFRGRMDESYDMVRTLRRGDYRYSQVYYPFRPDGQHVAYLWRAPNVQAWDTHHREGMTDHVTRAFFEPRPAEGLYNVTEDPYQLRNLADSAGYDSLLLALREEQLSYLREVGDLGFIPEGILYEKYRLDSVPYMRQYDRETLGTIIEAGVQATLRPDNGLVEEYAESDLAPVRFWGAMAAVQLTRNKEGPSGILEKLAGDQAGDIRVVAAEGLFYDGQVERAIDVLKEVILQEENPYVVIRALNTWYYLQLPADTIEDRLRELKDAGFPIGQSYVDRYAEKLLQTEI